MIFRSVVAVLVIWAFLSNANAAQPQNWQEIESEAIALLSRYIQIDTSNPPGNELKAAQFLKQVLEREGIEARVIESAPGRANFYARLTGNGTKKSVVLMHHMDVVPADARKWKEAPFGGAVKDGVVWGRGALDNKGSGVMAVMTLLTLKRNRVPLKGDLILLGTADEEAGGIAGAGYLLDKHPELFSNIDVVLNEGGGIRLGDDGRARLYSIGVAEKVPLWLKLTAHGSPGHAASPGNDQAVLKLVAALGRIAAYQPPIKVVDQVQTFYAASAASSPEKWRDAYRDLRRALQDPVVATAFTQDRGNNARVRNTISITRIEASDKINVISPSASAEIDVRLLPDEDPREFMAELRRVIADESIAMDVLLSRAAAASPTSAAALKAIADFAQTHDPGTPILMPLGTGFTDCHFFRAKGIPCFGFIPQRSTPAGEGLVHGIDERISVRQLTDGVRGVYELIERMLAR